MEDVKLPEVAIVDADAKVCNVCGVEKALTEYHPNKVCTKGVTGTCRICTAEKKRAWYAANRKRRQEVANKANRDLKIKAIEYMGGVCLDCKKEYPPCVMQFHHLDEQTKDENPSYYRYWPKLKAELDKCVMLCANCHLIRHHGGNHE